MTDKRPHPFARAIGEFISAALIATLALLALAALCGAVRLLLSVLGV